jgi:hypothetical protein
MKSQRGALLNTKTNKFWSKISTFIENKKVTQLFRFSYKKAKTPKSQNALASLNTWIRRLKFEMRAQDMRENVWKGISLIYTQSIP